MMDTAYPIAGWKFSEIVKQDTGLATNDVYGKLFHYVSSMLQSFHRRMRSLDIEIKMFCNDVQNLKDFVHEQLFDRIEV